MSVRIDNLAHHCTLVEDIDPHAKRCLSAMRRSGRDRMFTGHIGQRRLAILAVKTATPLLDLLSAIV